MPTSETVNMETTASVGWCSCAYKLYSLVQCVAPSRFFFFQFWFLLHNSSDLICVCQYFHIYFYGNRLCPVKNQTNNECLPSQIIANSLLTARKPGFCTTSSTGVKSLNAPWIKVHLQNPTKTFTQKQICTKHLCMWFESDLSCGFWLSKTQTRSYLDML